MRAVAACDAAFADLQPHVATEASAADLAELDRLVADIRARLPLEPGCEITLEANPGAADASRFRGYRAAGVNRLSLGIQSFSDASLRLLGRILGDVIREQEGAAAFELIEQIRKGIGDVPLRMGTFS